jgi:ankyrin repeat protein
MQANASSAALPLHAAAQQGRHDVVQQLLAAGADVNAEHEGLTPLIIAVVKGQHRVL